MEAPPSKRNPVASFTDEILAEILRRLPIRSVCQFKCVSRSWRDLISYSVHREKLPQTLVGVFYHSFNSDRCPMTAHHFTNVSGIGLPWIDPSFSFLGVPNNRVSLLDSCNGLLLCYWHVYHKGHEGDIISSSLQYAVCNPATHKWVMLPDLHHGWEGEVRLGFDPIVSSHFHVISYVLDEGGYVTGVEIYSSKTAAWTFKESEWGDDVMLHDRTRSVFLHGFIHMLTFDDGIVAVDMDGETWKTIPIPSGGGSGCIHQSQGRLYLLNTDSENAFKLSIWILEDYDTHKWTLKHTVCTAKLFRKNNLRFDRHYKVIAVHPECNLIFFVFGSDNTLMAYEMDRKEVRVIRKLGHDCSGPYLPCVPMWSALADEQI
ncbi:hypothetical protein U9M48_007784 [Paspalum notatum var. saurae]|uniref:F-box domain-containing protein n=1 Tax=Paspalum notatum var. saurae TaxID=547442 RepID=A0AAQ3SN68_PASNO